MGFGKAGAGGGLGGGEGVVEGLDVRLVEGGGGEGGGGRLEKQFVVPYLGAQKQ